MSKIFIILLLILGLFLLGYSLYSYFSRDIVYLSWETKKCVKIIDSSTGAERSCDLMLPNEKFVYDWVK